MNVKPMILLLAFAMGGYNLDYESEDLSENLVHFDEPVHSDKAVVNTTSCAAIIGKRDDAEEEPNGTVDRFSSDLELTEDGGSAQVIGMRFVNLNIPQGANITEAYVQFTVDAVLNVNPCNLQIYGEATDDALQFSSSSGDISSRAKTTASALWTPADWQAVGDRGPDQKTVNIAPLIQEIVNRPGYTASSAIVVIIEGVGTREAESFNGDTAISPELCVTYGSTPPPISISSVVTDESQAGASDGAVDITVSGGAPSYTYQWSNGATTEDITGLAAGTYTVTVTDSGGSTESHVATVAVVSGTEVCSKVSVWTDDGEEKTSNNSVVLYSGDLDLGSVETVGVRFLNLNIPQGATINDASIQFTTNNLSNGIANLTIYGEDVDDAVTFTANDFDITNRSLTSAQVSWSPDPWLAYGDRGAAEKTPDISSLIQEIVNRPGYSASSSISIIISGTGARAAISYDGNSGRAPELCVNYEAPVPTCQPILISAGSDDAEEATANGNMNIFSSDLDLGGVQVVGLRFTGLNIPQGSTISGTSIQFTTNNISNGTCNLVVAGEDTDNAVTFSSINSNITSRPLTSAQVNWSPPDWSIQGEKGPDQKTPDLSSILQEIVNRPNYTASSAISIIISGTGARAAMSFNGDPGLAPEICVEYQIEGPTYQHVVLEKKLDGSYFLTPGRVIPIKYIEDYAIVNGVNDQAAYKIFDKARTEVVAGVITNEYGVNWKTITIPEGLDGDEFYVLEVSGPNKEEVYYLRFKIGKE